MGKKNRVFNFLVEVCVESPGDVDDETAAEDAAEYMSSMTRARGRVHDSFASVTRWDEVGMIRPDWAPVKQKWVEGGSSAPIKKKKKLAKAKPKKAKVKRI